MHLKVPTVQRCPSSPLPWEPGACFRYHLMYKPPPTMEIQARLLQHPKDSEERVKFKVDLYYRNSAELGHFYRWATTINGDQDPYTVFEYIESGIINPLPKKGL
ncbi:adenylate kinase 8-like isoform X1 [Marmota monax]|uniref:adenylate kinase 8-like isoform X1 n=1 Tax=Marmota monax TaxID=9995 RepID=UPI0026F2CF85|nr:adenylate kinase 8-like isoform X1 [Marmota monax]